MMSAPIAGLTPRHHTRRGLALAMGAAALLALAVPATAQEAAPAAPPVHAPYDELQGQPPAAPSHKTPASNEANAPALIGHSRPLLQHLSICFQTIIILWSNFLKNRTTFH